MAVQQNRKSRSRFNRECINSRPSNWWNSSSSPRD